MAKRIPKFQQTEMPLPEATSKEIPTPTPSNIEKPAPDPRHMENVVQFGDEEIELKATKLKYQRDRTAAFYRILQQMPLVDILALNDGVLDAQRSSDKMLFDWLVAVTDDSKLVSRNYDKLDSESIERILKIFCRLNKIDDREERKNRQTQAMTP